MAADLLAALKAALPYVEKVADTVPTEWVRQQRQREAAKLVAYIRATIANAERETT